MAYQFPLNGGRINASIGGNSTSAGAGYSLISTGTMLLAGGNNVTLSQNGSAVTIQAGGGFALNDGVNTISTGSARVSALGALTASINGQTLSLEAPAQSSLSATGAVSISRNASTISIGAPIMSLGMNTSTAGGGTGGVGGTVSNGLHLFAGSNVTLSQGTNSNGASVSMYAGGGGSLQISASNTSANLASVTFSNSNGLSFGLNAGVVTASHNGLTSQSNQALSASNGSFAFQTAGFSNANGVTFGTSAGSIMTASVNTSYAASNHSHGNPTLNLTNLSGTTASASNGMTLSLSAASQTVQTQSRFNLSVSGNTSGVMAQVSSGTLTLAGGNNITLSQNGNAITISGAAGGGGGVALYDGVNSISSGTARISVAGALTASVNGQTLSLSAPVVSSLSATGAVSISNNAGTISIGAPAFSAGASNTIAGGSTSGTMGTANTGGVAFYAGSNIGLSQSTSANGRASITIQAAGGGGGGGGTLSMYALGNTTQNSSASIDVRSVSINGLGGLTAGYSNGSIQMSAPVVSNIIATGALSISNSSNSLSIGVPAFSMGTAASAIVTNRVVLTAGANITLSQSTNSNGATISIAGAAGGTGGGGGGGGTLSMYALGNTTQNSSAAIDMQSVSINGLGGLTAGYSNGSIQMSAPMVTHLSATGGVNISYSSNTVSIGVPVLERKWLEIAIRPSMTNLTNVASVNGVPLLQPFHNEGNLTVSRLNWEMSRVTTANNQFTVHAGIYEYVNNTQLSLVGSASGSFSNTLTASVSGIRRFAIDGFNISTFGPGAYVLGMIFTANGASTSLMNYLLRGVGATNTPQLGAVLPGSDQYNTATSYNIYPFFGRYTTTSNAMPGTIGESQVRGQFSGVSQALNWWVGLNG